MIVVTDATKRGLLTAERVRDLVEELKIRVEDLKVIVNRCPEDVDRGFFAEELRRRGLELAGVVPADPQVAEFDLKGRPVMELPRESPAVAALYEIMDRVLDGR